MAPIRFCTCWPTYWNVQVQVSCYETSASYERLKTCDIPFQYGTSWKRPGSWLWGPQDGGYGYSSKEESVLLERWLTNMLARQFEGRHNREGQQTVTKQRVEDQFDLELRGAVMHDILDMMQKEFVQTKLRRFCNICPKHGDVGRRISPWKVPGLPVPIENIILRYVTRQIGGRMCPLQQRKELRIHKMLIVS